jgi:hypothetical protein
MMPMSLLGTACGNQGGGFRVAPSFFKSPDQSKELQAMITPIPCPFVYANGKHCSGHIVRVEAYKADITWTPNGETGKWEVCAGQPRSHYHLFCSEKDNHAGCRQPDSGQMKFYLNQLPKELLEAME